MPPIGIPANAVEYYTTLSSSVVNGICLSQTPAAAGLMALNGSLVVNGLATLDTTQNQKNTRQVLITCAGADVARTFTISGTLYAGGPTVTEPVLGSNGSTTTSVNFFYQVSIISVDAATAGAVQIGTNGVGASAWFLVPQQHNTYGLAIGMYPIGTVNWTLQFCMSAHILDILPPYIPYWFPHSVLASIAVATSGNFAYPPIAYRTMVNSGTGTVVTQTNQPQTH